MSAVEASELVVVYKGGVKALDGFSLSVGKRELFALVGPNGAGKTTAMKVFTTLLRPTQGEAYVAGHNVLSEAGEVRRIIGYVPQNLSADDELTGMENLVLQGRLYGMNSPEARRRAKELLEMVGLVEAGNRVVGSYSGGMRRRLEIAMGLIHTPEILFLDEPTLGLDVQSRLLIWEHIKQLKNEEGVTIVFTTHYMDEADRLSERVGIIDSGRVVALGSPSELKAGIGGDIIVLKASGGDVADALRGLESVSRVDYVDGEFRVKVANGEEALPEVVKHLVQRGITVERVSLTKPSLDQVFVEYTGKTYREEEPPDYLLQTYIRGRRM